MPEWTRYKATIPSGSGVSSRDVQTMERVRHIVHVANARRILEDKTLRAGLVYDESVLNKSRMCVTWFSANSWAGGSIYGNVELTFFWAKLVANRRFYWVEAMTHYTPRAFRILITDRDLSGSKFLTPYDPAIDEGPLRSHAGIWYRNADYTSEFMIEGDVDLADCVELDFVSHHPHICRSNGANCVDRSAASYKTGGRILAFLLGNDLHCLDHALKQPSIYDANRKLSYTVDNGIDGIVRALGNKKIFSGGVKSASSRVAVLRGALALYGADQKHASRGLLSLLKSQSVFETALEEIVNSHFKIEGWTLPQ